jgi:pimeloyl-ACP methyl ester carboxylesterase
VTGLPGIELDDWRAKALTLDFAGRQIRYWLGGEADAEPLLLIHGFPTASWDWHRLWAPLAER